MKKFLFLLLFLSSFLVQAQSYLPKSTGVVIKKSYYTFSYDEANEQAKWVYYELDPKFTNGKAKRHNDFRPDRSVRTGSATLADYRSSGYDRGHLCPAAAMKLNPKAMSETFFMSNMSPQSPDFNRGIWKDLEAIVRDWVRNERRLYVVTGPIFKDNKGKIGKSGVTIPGYYFKVIYDPTDKEKMIALILPNKKCSKSLSSYVVPVDKVEALTGINFFPQLADSKENSLEAKSNATSWTWKAKKHRYSASSKTTKSSSSVFNSSKTNKSGKHRCRAITKKGTQCKRNAKSGSNFCTQHAVL